MSIRLETELDTKQLAIQLTTDNNERELIQLVKEIDDGVCAIEFTEKLYHHFKQIVEHEQAIDEKEAKEVSPEKFHPQNKTR